MSKEQEELVTKIKALLVKQYGGITLESMRKLFDFYDKNHDNKISGDELETLLKDADIGNRLTRGAWIKGIIGHLDENGNKQIDWEEFAKAVR